MSVRTFEIEVPESQRRDSARSSFPGRQRGSTWDETYGDSDSMEAVNAATLLQPGDTSGSGVPAAIFNLANTIMGASLTGLPFTVRSGGIIPFLLFITLSASMGLLTLRMLVDSSFHALDGKKDYQAVGRTAFGNVGMKITAAATCLSCYGALVSYFVLVGTTAPILCKLAGFALAPWKLQALMAVSVIGPLCSLKDVSALAPASLFALTVFALMALTSVASFVFQDTFYEGAIEKYGLPRDVDGVQWFPKTFGFNELSKFPTLIMAFNCQYAMLPIVANLRQGRREDMYKVCAGGMGAAYSVYVLHAVTAYLAFAGNTKDMILLNYRHCYRDVCTLPGYTLQKCPAANVEKLCEDDNPFITVLNGLFLLAVLMGYPCVHFALRRAQIAMTVGVDSEFSWATHLGLASFNICLTLFIALLVGSKISIVFGWTGAVASPLISFILPSLFYVRILGGRGVPLASPERLKGIGALVYGILVMCLGVTCNLNATS